MIYILLLFYGIILFLVAELFGRGKHIGRWWTFALLACTPVLPGIIALLSSPNANAEPTKANKTTKAIGWILVILGLIGIVPAIFAGPIAFSFPLMFCVSGAYLIQQGKGSVSNINPKFYFSSFSWSGSNIAKMPSLRLAFKGSNRNYYYIVEEGKQSEPYTFEQLKGKQIKETDLVWRKGMENWLPAKDISELESIIFYLPPPLLKEEPVLFSEEVFEEVKVSNEVLTTTSDSELVIISLPKLNVFERFITWLTFTASYLIIIISFILLSKDSKIHYKQKLRKYWQE